LDVVDFASGGWLVAVEVDAADVSGHHRSPDPDGDGAGGSADIEWFAVAA
jgi:hypothetical protein